MRDPWELNSPTSDSYKELVGTEGQSHLPSLPTKRKNLTRLNGRMGQWYGSPGTADYRQNRFYFLSLTDVNDPSWSVFQILPLVQSLGTDKEFATFFQWTLGGKPMRQPTGRREELIKIKGRGAPIDMGVAKGFCWSSVDNKPNPSGISNKWLEKSNKQNALEQFEALHEFLNFYDETGKQKHLELVLHMPFEDLSYYVEPTGFSWSSSTDRSKFGFDYELSLKSYAYAGPKHIPHFDEAINDQNALAEVQQFAAESAAFKKEIESVGNSFVNYGSHWVNLTGGMIATTSSFLGVYSDSELLKMPSKIVATTHLALSKAISDLDQLSQATPFVDKNNAFSQLMREWRFSLHTAFDAATYTIAGVNNNTLGFPLSQDELDRARNEVESAAGYFIPESTTAFGDPGEGNEPGLIAPAYEEEPEAPVPIFEYTIKEGDSFESIALYQLGNSADWTIIAKLNGSTDSHGLWGNKPLTVGEKIWVPKEMLNLNVGTTADVDPFLTDFKIGSDGDFVLAGSEYNDVTLVTGPTCLKQDLAHSLITVKGNSRVFPNMGLTYEVGTPATIGNIAQIVFDVRETIKKDPRVASVTNTEIIDGGDRMVINSVATSVDHKTIEIAVPA